MEINSHITGSPPQIGFILDTFPTIIFKGGRGSGKTYAGAEKAAKFHMENQGCTTCATEPTYKAVYDNLIPTYTEVFMKHGLLDPVKGMGQIIRSTTGDGPKIILPQGLGHVLLRSTDDPDHLRGMNLAGIHMDEAAQSPYLAYQILSACLRQPGHAHQIWLTTTPLGPEHWISQLEKRPGVALYRSSMFANTFLAKDFLERMKREYTGEFYRREILGEDVVLTGQCRFDTMTLRRMLESAPQPIYTDGFVEVYKEPIVGRKYIAGGDASEGLAKGDRSCIQILDAQRGDQVCVIYGQIPPDELAFLADRWCRKYNNALYNEPHDSIDIAVHVKLDDLNYPNRVKRWKTSSLWKSMAEAELAEAISRGELLLYQENTIKEMCTYIKDEKSAKSCHGAEGCRDDTVAALLAAWQARKEPGAYTDQVVTSDYVTWR